MDLNTKITPEDLNGQWFICYSNFPMWKNAKKQQPSFNYTLITKGEKKVLLDEVKYITNGRVKTITGYDSPTDANNRRFTWRGKGLLFFFKSKWEVSWINAEKNIALIRFSKTLATPEGFDIITRPGHESHATEAFEQLSETEKKSMFVVKRS